MSSFSMIRKLYHLLTFFLRGGVAYAQAIGVNIGCDCRIITRHFGTEPFLITIGDRVTITAGVRFLTHDGSLWLFKDENGRRYKYQPIVLKNDIFIGVNSVIMPGVIIENNVIVAAGSVVTKSIPSGVIVAGTPAVVIGNYQDFRAKCLFENPSDADIDKSLPFKARVLKIVDYRWKRYLSKVNSEE